ncbi:hypothetical protein ACVME5_001687 [Bradyrhizobium liaoningense]
MKVWLLAALVIALSGTTARAADPRYPDWPCTQAKVPEISLAAVWAGPPLDDVQNKWKDDARVSALVAKLAARKTPLDEAEKSVKEFLAASGSDKTANAKLLFAGLFDTLNAQRSQVMNGLERVSRKQREAADKIREETLQLHTLQGGDTPRRGQGRGAQQRADLEDPYLRGPHQGGALRLRGSNHDRPAPVRARPRDPAGNGIAAASLTAFAKVPQSLTFFSSYLPEPNRSGMPCRSEPHTSGGLDGNNKIHLRGRCGP